MKMLGTSAAMLVLGLFLSSGAEEPAVVISQASPATDAVTPSLANEARAAIDRSVKWLLSKQAEDGSWSNSDFPALTALSVWAIADAGQKSSPEIDKAVNTSWAACAKTDPSGANRRSRRRAAGSATTTPRSAWWRCIVGPAGRCAGGSEGAAVHRRDPALRERRLRRRHGLRSRDRPPLRGPFQHLHRVRGDEDDGERRGPAQGNRPARGSRLESRGGFSDEGSEPAEHERPRAPTFPIPSAAASRTARTRARPARRPTRRARSGSAPTAA